MPLFFDDTTGSSGIFASARANVNWMVLGVIDRGSLPRRQNADHQLDGDYDAEQENEP
jgi:hypothetical protein